MRAAAAVPVVLIVAGLGLLVASAWDGAATLAIVVIVPVLYGRSLEFVAGALLLVAGLFCLPLAFSSDEPVHEEALEDAPPSTGGGVGGVVLLGPVPIVFGSWKGISGRTRLLLSVVGAAVVIVAVALFLLVWL